MNKERLEKRITQLEALRMSHQMESIRRDVELNMKIKELVDEWNKLYGGEEPKEYYDPRRIGVQEYKPMTNEELSQKLAEDIQ